MRTRTSVFVAVLGAMMLIACTAAIAKDAGNKGDISSTLDVLTPVSLAGTSLQPGTYTVKATNTTVTFVKNGKTVAQSNVEWKDSPQKASATNLLAESGTVKEIHFAGKTRYVTIAQ